MRLAHSAGGAFISGLFSHGGARSGMNVTAVYGAGRALGYSGAVRLSYGCSDSCTSAGGLASRTRLFVATPVVLQPAVDVPSLWVVMSPVYDAAAIIGFIDAVILNGIAAL